MRQLFLVLTKIVGLLQIYWGIAYLSSITMFFGTMGRTQETPFGQWAVRIGGIALFSFLCFGMAWVLLFRTEWLADKLKITEETESKELEADVILRTGVKLIGVFVAVHAIPETFKALSEWITTIMSLGGLRDSMSSRMFWVGSTSGIWTKVLPALLKLALGVFVAMKSDKVLNMITKDKGSTEQDNGQISSESALPDELSL